MKSNISITKYKRAKSVLEKKLMTEGLTKDEKYLLDNVNSIFRFIMILFAVLVTKLVPQSPNNSRSIATTTFGEYSKTNFLTISK